MTIEIINVDTPTLGDRGYIAHDGKTALVVDPQRDIDRVEQVLSDHSLALGAVVETHMHNDYVSGGLVLARKYQAKYITSADCTRSSKSLAESTSPSKGETRPVAVATKFVMTSPEAEVVISPAFIAPLFEAQPVSTRINISDWTLSIIFIS